MTADPEALRRIVAEGRQFYERYMTHALPWSSVLLRKWYEEHMPVVLAALSPQQARDAGGWLPKLREAVANELKYGLSAGRRSAERCAPLARIFRTGRGGLHIADLHIRNDGIEYRVSAEWVASLARLAVWVEKALTDPQAFLEERATIEREVQEAMARQATSDYQEAAKPMGALKSPPPEPKP